AFIDGHAAVRAGDIATCIRSWRRAVTIDPRFAAAQAWFAVAVTLVPALSDFSVAREALEVASRYRDTLPDRDRGVFGALEHMLAADPPDAAAFVAGIRPLLDLHPDDSELRMLYARGLQAEGKLDEANRELARIIDNDPDFAGAYILQVSIADASHDQA